MVFATDLLNRFTTRTILIQHTAGMSRKKCLDNSFLYFFSRYMGNAPKENNIRRWVNESFPKNARKILPSPVVRYSIKSCRSRSGILFKKRASWLCKVYTSNHKLTKTTPKILLKE